MAGVSEVPEHFGFEGIGLVSMAASGVSTLGSWVATPFVACQRRCSARSALKSRVDHIALRVPHQELLRLKAIAETLTKSNKISQFDCNKLVMLLGTVLKNEVEVFGQKLSSEEHGMLTQVETWAKSLNFDKDPLPMTSKAVRLLQSFNDLLEAPFSEQVGVVHAAKNQLVHLAYNDHPLPMLREAINLAESLDNKMIAIDPSRFSIRNFKDSSKLSVLVYNIRKAFPASTEIVRDLDIIEEEFTALEENPKAGSAKLLGALERIRKAYEGLVPRLREDIDATRETSLESIKRMFRFW